MPSFCVPKNSSFIATFAKNHFLRAMRIFGITTKEGANPPFGVTGPLYLLLNLSLSGIRLSHKID